MLTNVLEGRAIGVSHYVRPSSRSCQGQLLSSMGPSADIEEVKVLRHRIVELRRSDKLAKKRLGEAKEEIRDVKSDLGGAREEILDLQENLNHVQESLEATKAELKRYRAWWLNEYHFVKLLITMIPKQAADDVQVILASSEARYVDWSGSMVALE